jgi:hypothetical protein
MASVRIDSPLLALGVLAGLHGAPSNTASTLEYEFDQVQPTEVTVWNWSDSTSGAGDEISRPVSLLAAANAALRSMRPMVDWERSAVDDFFLAQFE